MDSSNEIAIVMVPFPAESHLNQLLQLASRVRANALNPSNIAKIHFHDLPTPDFASPTPNPNALSKFPSQLFPSFDANSKLLREPIASFLRDVSSKSRRVIVVHDVLIFTCIPKGMPIPLEDELLQKLPSLELDAPEEINKLVAFQLQYRDIRAGDLYNSNKVLEGNFLDLMAKFASTQNKKQWAIGPILPTKLDHVSNKRNICLDWLNNQPLRSVLYVSFGSSTTFSDKEIMKLGLGLERSEQKFIWVLRDADRGDIFKGEDRRFELPEGFEEKVKGVRLVVREWAPQLEILAHSSTGLIVREWEKREELVSASTIENVVRKLMASEEGDEIRKRTEELGEAVRQSREKGGSSQLELHSFIAHITR
ncbi:PREDICTED: zeatin O-xylosyltransferase-like [Nicotiana attenuata]|uniref:zeatin O-xylosyltransferase-like n=1 Tax=Nicotiana attenuata TaxID=49451 RepID=UPI0009056496|nr:PREDICTED: zeatin O-xylosyltransferase-like [Nicotiana attenuata]